MSKKSLTPCKSVLITFHGDTTHATQLTGYAHDTRAKSACSRRNPTDEYDAYEGARIALARLFGVNPFPELENKEAAPEKTNTPEKSLPEYKTGARVRVIEPCIAADYRKGDVGTVVLIPYGPEGGAYIQFDHLRGPEKHRAGIRYCYRSEFELTGETVEKSKQPETPKAKAIKDFEVKVTVTPIYEEDEA